MSKTDINFHAYYIVVSTFFVPVYITIIERNAARRVKNFFTTRK